MYCEGSDRFAFESHPLARLVGCPNTRMKEVKEGIVPLAWYLLAVNTWLLDGDKRGGKIRK